MSELHTFDDAAEYITAKYQPNKGAGNQIKTVEQYIIDECCSEVDDE